MLVQLNIQKTTAIEKFVVEIDDQCTIKELTLLLEDKHGCGPAATQKVIHKAKILNHTTLICQIPNCSLAIDFFVVYNTDKSKSKPKPVITETIATPISNSSPTVPLLTETFVASNSISQVEEKFPVFVESTNIPATETKDAQQPTSSAPTAVAVIPADIQALTELGASVEAATSALARFGNVQIAANYLLSQNGNDNQDNQDDQDDEDDQEGDDDDEGMGMLMAPAAFRARLIAMMAARFNTDPAFAALHTANPAAALDQFAQELMQNPQGLFPQGAGVQFAMGPFDANYDDDDGEGDEDFVPPE